jgi:hypothetical protein
MTVDVLTNRYANTRIGANTHETRLNTSTVEIRQFGKLFTRTLDGDLYAQPLVVTGLNIAGKTRNVVYLATARNWVYAYDADDYDACIPLWSRNLGAPVPRDAIFENYLNFASDIGITSTPVIERDAHGGGTMYVVYKTRTVADGTSTFYYRLQALDILTGQDRPDPGTFTNITATVSKEDGSSLAFDPHWHLNRPGLLLQKGVIYIAFGSHGDVGTFYGWIMAYDARTLQQIAAYNTAPDWGQGGVWQSGTGLAADDDGFVYVVVGNGQKPSVNAQQKPPIPQPSMIVEPVYGNCLLKMMLVRHGDAGSLKVVDWFTASDTMHLNEFDTDFIGGPVLFDAPPVPGSSGQLLLGGGKDGKFYLADRNNLGRFMLPANTTILQAEPLCVYHIHGAPVLWKDAHGQWVAYVWSEKDFLKALRFNGKTFDARPLSTSVYGFPQDELRMPGGILAVSSNGDQDGSAIVWASHPTDDDGMNKTVRGTLRAYDARDLNRELWTSDMDAEGLDRVGSFAKFCPPVVANGKVYLATFSRELVVYGLFADIGRKPRDQDCGLFRLQAVTAGPPVQQSGSYACSRYDLRITGQGIGGTSDNFLFAYVNRDSDNEPVIRITARFEGINAPNYPHARAGVMIRKFDEPGHLPPLRFAAMLITNQNQALFLHRDADGAAAAQDGPIDVTIPCFIRLTGQKVEGAVGFVDFTGEVSQDGLTWKAVSAVTRIKIDGELMTGLAVTAQTGPAPDVSTMQAHACFSKAEVVPDISNMTAAPAMLLEEHPAPGGS